MGLDDGANRRERASEDQEDMLVAAGKDLTALLMLKKCYEEMMVIAEPFSEASGKIKIPGSGLPFEKISEAVKMAVNRMDGAFIETMAMTEFMQVFRDGLEGVVKKIEKLQAAGGGLGRDLR